MVAEVVQLQASNFRDPAATLRVIAEKIEAGTYGPVGCVAVVILGDEMHVSGAGEDAEAPSVAMLLHAGFMRLSRSVEEHGRG